MGKKVKLNAGLEKRLTGITEMREILLGNLAMVAEIPAQTFEESARAEFLVQRFVECGVSDTTIDELFNVSALINPGCRRTIMVSTHMDNVFSNDIDQCISISENHVYGAGVADDNLAVAVMLTIPDLLKHLAIHLNCSLMLVASSRFHNHGDYEGIRRFIRSYPGKISAGININGITLGSINYFTLSRIRCEIHCELEEDSSNSPMLKMSGSNAIMALNDLITHLYSIPLPSKPRTLLNIGRIESGERYSTVSKEGTMLLEALSEDDHIMDELIRQIKNISADISARQGVKINTDFFGRHTVSALSSDHPIVRTALEVFNSLGLTPQMEYTNSQIAVTLAEGIPSINIGLTTGKRGNTPKSNIDIEQLSVGILQLIMLLEKIDALGDIDHV